LASNITLSSAEYMYDEVLADNTMKSASSMRLHRKIPKSPLGKGLYIKTEVRGYLAMKGKGKAKEALNQTVIYVTAFKGILR